MGNTQTPCRIYITCGGWNPIDKKPRSHSTPKSIWDKSFNYPKRAEPFQLQTRFFFEAQAKITSNSLTWSNIEIVELCWNSSTQCIYIMPTLISIVSLWIFKNEFDQNANVSGSNVRVQCEFVIWGAHWYSRQCSTNILETPQQTRAHTRSMVSSHFKWGLQNECNKNTDLYTMVSNEQIWLTNVKSYRMDWPLKTINMWSVLFLLKAPLLLFQGIW